MFDLADQAATLNMMLTLSQEYVYVYTFITLAAAAIGFIGSGWAIYTLARVHLTGSIPPEKFTTGMALAALFFCGALGAFSTIMAMVSASFLDSGGGSLFPTVLAGSDDPLKLTGLFAEQTVKILGYMMGFYGLIEMYVSRMPEGDRSKLTSGAIRLACGGVLISARLFGNLFGGLGDRIFG